MSVLDLDSCCNYTENISVGLLLFILKKLNVELNFFFYYLFQICGECLSGACTEERTSLCRHKLDSKSHIQMKYTFGMFKILHDDIGVLIW